jgi:hypothetical protein
MMMMPETNCAPKLAHADEDFLCRVVVSQLQAHRDVMNRARLAAVAADDIDREPLAGGVKEACDSAAFCCQPVVRGQRGVRLLAHDRHTTSFEQ